MVWGLRRERKRRLLSTNCDTLSPQETPSPWNLQSQGQLLLRFSIPSSSFNFSQVFLRFRCFITESTNPLRLVPFPNFARVLLIVLDSILVCDRFLNCLISNPTLISLCLFWVSRYQFGFGLTSLHRIVFKAFLFIVCECL